ncbi:unnamed protein product, partial [Protopolystoma xenopodis]
SFRRHNNSLEVSSLPRSYTAHSWPNVYGTFQGNSSILGELLKLQIHCVAWRPESASLASECMTTSEGDEQDGPFRAHHRFEKYGEDEEGLVRFQQLPPQFGACFSSERSESCQGPLASEDDNSTHSFFGVNLTTLDLSLVEYTQRKCQLNAHKSKETNHSMLIPFSEFLIALQKSTSEPMFQMYTFSNGEPCLVPRTVRLLCEHMSIAQTRLRPDFVDQLKSWADLPNNRSEMPKSSFDQLADISKLTFTCEVFGLLLI